MEPPMHQRHTRAPRSATPWTGLLLVAMWLAPGVAAEPTDAPLPPVALTADSTGENVVLSWHAPPGDVDAYRVYRADDATAVAMHGLDAFTAIGETSALEFVDLGSAGSGAEGDDLPEDPVYYVTTLRGGDESLPSNPVDGEYPACWDIFRPTDCFIP